MLTERQKWLKADRELFHRLRLLCMGGHPINPERPLCQYCHETYMVERERRERQRMKIQDRMDGDTLWAKSFE